MASDPSAASSRRRFLGALTFAIGSIPIVGTLFVALRAGLAPAFSDRPERVPLCRRDELPAGEEILQRAVSYQMRRGPQVEQVSKLVLVTRDPDTGEPIAMLGECTHLSCPVQAPRRVVAGGGEPIECPCHGGRFDRAGRVLDGPPPAPLRRLPLEVPAEPDGTVFVRGV